MIELHDSCASSCMMELRSRHGTQFLWNGDAKYWRDRAPVLFPYVARLTDGSYTLYGERYSMDIHGFAKDSVFSVEEQSADSVTLCLHETPETLRQYPFRFTFRVRYALRGWTVNVTILSAMRTKKSCRSASAGIRASGFRWQKARPLRTTSCAFRTPASRIASASQKPAS